MAREPTPIDIGALPELLRIAEEVRATKQPRLLRRDSEDVALLTPVEPPLERAPAGRHGGRLTRDDALFNLIGLAAGPDDGATDVSANKLKYVAEAYTAKPE